MINFPNLDKLNQFSKVLVMNGTCKPQFDIFLKTVMCTHSRLYAINVSNLPKKPKSIVETKAKYPRMLMILPVAMALVATSIFVSKKFILSTKSELESSDKFSKTIDSEYENKVLAELEARHKRKTEI